MTTPSIEFSHISIFRDEDRVMPEEVARWTLEHVGLPSEGSRRLANLRERNSEDELTEIERQELHDYLTTLSTIELLKAKAKRALES